MNPCVNKKVAAVLFAALAIGLATVGFAASEPPNIVLILSDDQAWTDYGFMGHTDIKTPHLDRLAERSLVFERGYVAAPICRPSLASIVTGLYPFQHGTTACDVDFMRNRAALDAPFREAFHKHPSFIKMLTANGYLTFQSGKWWEGSFRDGGFTHGMTHGDPKRGGRHGDAGLAIGRKGIQAVKHFIDNAENQDKPFFVWYAPLMPHTPHNPPERLLKNYIRPGLPADQAKYYAMCEWFDETCGELLDYLDEKKLTENTVVLYICDNGWATTSSNKDDTHQKNWPHFALRSKGSPYENGIRTPILVSWPGRVEPARVDDLAYAIDLFPTVAAATKLKAPAALPGINLLDAKARTDRKAIFGVCHSQVNMTLGDPNDTLQYRWCIEGDWKLLLRYQGRDVEDSRGLIDWDTEPVRLYNLKDDPHEEEDLAPSRPEIVKRLTTLIDDWHPVDSK